MKRLFITLACVATTTVAIMAQAPQWVVTHPVSEKEYVGIGSASLSDADHVKKATANALADISSQIAIKVENNSFLHTVDVDGKSREMLEDKIEGSLAAWIEGQELKESYSSEDTYYVYYTLDKKKYAKNTETRRKQILSTGIDYLQKGRDAEASMNLTQALRLYCQGLESVTPWLFMNLTATIDGSTTNIPVELYNSCINLFAGMAITTNVANIEGESFKAINTPIAGCLSKNGEVVPNVKLKATFVTGSGAISPAIETDFNGTAEFYVTNITSKEKVQEVRISIDEEFVNSLPETGRELLKGQMWPSAKVTITLKNATVTAYIYMNEKNDLEGIEKQMSRLLTNNYFVVSEDPDAATCFIDISSEMDMGNTVGGGLYDLNTCYCTLTVKIYDNKSEELLLDYSVNRLKVLSPAQNTAEETIATGIREVMKRVNRELPGKLKKINLN